MRKFLIMGAAVSMLGAGFGCSRSLDRARADVHQDMANRDAAHGKYYKAAKEERKADIDRGKAVEAPLP